MKYLIVFLLVFYTPDELTDAIEVYNYDSKLEYGIEVTESDYIEPSPENEDYKKSYKYINNQIQQIIYPWTY